MTPSDASTPPAPSAARAAGSVLAGHRIEAVLHAGPVFTVYRAVDALGIERVALKEYCPQAQCGRDAEGAPCLRDPNDPAAHAAFEAGRAAFVEEMRRLARLRLPGVVRVRDLIEAEGSLCALMPLLPGVPLDELPPSQNDEALHALLLSLVEPLAQLHAAGQVHGTLHARQLLWSPGRAPVLLGFGSAARVLGVHPEPDDRAPELRTPDPQPGPAVGPWTDVYALAAMVLRQTSGRPWDGAAEAMGVAALLEKALGPAVDAGKRQVLVKALQSSLDRTPTRRPCHAGELRAQLVAAGVSRSAKAAGAAPPPSQPRPAPQPGEAGRASSRLPEAMARSGPEPAMPALRPDGSCVIPQSPRRRDDSRRNAFLVLALALGCVASGWWVRGLWSDEQERQRVDRLLVGAANPPAWAAAPDGGEAGLPPLPVAQDATELPPAPTAPGEPSPLEALAEARAPAAPETRPAGVPAEPLAAVRETHPAVVEVAPLPASVAATPVAAQRAPSAAAVQVPEPAAVAQTPALEKPLVSVAPPSAAAAADKPSQEAAPSPARAQPPSAPDAQPTSRPAVQAARAPRSAEAKAARSAKAPVKATAGRGTSTTPRAACGTQAKYALLQCMKRQCSQSSQREHPQCQLLLRENVISS